MPHSDASNGRWMNSGWANGVVDFNFVLLEIMILCGLFSGFLVFFCFVFLFCFAFRCVFWLPFMFRFKQLAVESKTLAY